MPRPIADLKENTTHINKKNRNIYLVIKTNIVKSSHKKVFFGQLRIGVENNY